MGSEGILGSFGPVLVLGRACEPEPWGWAFSEFLPFPQPHDSQTLPCIWAGKGVEKRPSIYDLLWHVNYFELKAIKTLQTHKKLLYLHYRI